VLKGCRGVIGGTGVGRGCGCCRRGCALGSGRAGGVGARAVRAGSACGKLGPRADFIKAFRYVVTANKPSKQ
jgi:hypothetical protein